MLTLKRFVKAIVLNTLEMIPIAALIAGVVVFFSNVLFGQSWNFSQLWRIFYVYPLAILYAVTIIRTILVYIALWAVSTKIKRPFGKVEKAFMEYPEMTEKRHLREWTTEYFDKEFASWEIASELTKIVMKSPLFKR